MSIRVPTYCALLPLIVGCASSGSRDAASASEKSNATSSLQRADCAMHRDAEPGMGSDHTMPSSEGDGMMGGNAKAHEHAGRAQAGSESCPMMAHQAQLGSAEPPAPEP